MIYQNPNYCMGNRPAWQKFMVALGILKNPWLLLLDKLGLVKKPVYRSWSGMKFETRGKTTDINDAVVVLSGKEYPPALLGLDDCKNSPPIVLDCGGHIGSFTMYVKSHWPNAKIVVMEPVPDNLNILQANIARNRLSDVTVIPFALYGQEGTYYIDLAGKQFDAVNITSAKPSHDQFITIVAKALDKMMDPAHPDYIFLPTIDLMKLDIEGAEYNVFANSLNALASHVRRIIMEFHPAGDTAKRAEIINQLCGNGPFQLIYETKNILGFENTSLENAQK